MLAQRGLVTVKVFYTWGESSLSNKLDPGFGKKIVWDIPILDGYDFEFLENVSDNASSKHYNGIVNPDIVNKVNHWKPNAILVFGWKFNSHLKVLIHFKNRIPIFFRGDSTLLSEPRRPSVSKMIRRLSLKWIYRHIDYALFVGSNNRDYFLRHGVKPSQLVHCPHAIDNARFKEPDHDYASKALQIKERLNIKEGEKVFLFAGKLDQNKNVILLIKAFNKLNLSSTHLVIVGDGNLETSLKQIARGNANIHFMGFQNQTVMPIIYRIGDVYVLPSKNETWGLGANEAMASGCALLMSDTCGGAVDLLKDSKNGLVFRSNDMADLCDKLIHLSQTADLNEMKQFSKIYIERFSFENICEAIETLLKNIRIDLTKE